MLLCEIKTIKREMADGTYTHEFDEYETLNTKEYKTGIHSVHIHLQKEELMLFNRYNIPKPPENIPVLYAFTLNEILIGDEELTHVKDIMDAIKKRNPNHTMTNAEIEKFVRTGLKKVLNHSLPKTDQRTTRDIQYAAIQKLFNRLKNNHFHPEDRNNIVLVTLASSSPTVKHFADIISEYLGGVNIIHGAFLKNNWPRLSNYVYTGGVYIPRIKRNASEESNIPHNKLKEYQQTIEHLTKHIENLNNSDYANMEELNMAHQELTKTEHQLEILTNKINNKEITIAPNMIDNKNEFYNFQLAVKETAIQLQNKDVIFIDDNIVSGKTISDAIKSLYKMRIIPKSMIGFCPHKLINTKNV
jgi:hypothetical protein